MIGTSVPEYVLIRFCIFALRAVTPLSIFYVAFSVADPPSSVPGKLLLGWCVVETAFWLLVYLPRKRRLQAPAQHPPVLDREGRKELFWKCWENIPNPEYYLTRWFLNAKAQEIKRENIKDFFRWALLNKGDLDGEIKAEEVESLQLEEEELEEYVDGVQTLLGRPLEPGRGNAECLRLTLDEVKMLHRPLLWYLVVGLVDFATAIYLRYRGFFLYRTSLRASFTAIIPFRVANLFTTRVSPSRDLSYWYRAHTSKTRLPILFIHGIGIGLYPYAQFLVDINKHDKEGPDDGEIGIIALEVMPISFRITRPILAKQELCRQIDAILNAHGWEEVVVACHSYGSVITTHLLHTTSPVKSKIESLLFIDPVTFLLHLPDVCYNFTARKPRRANEHQLHYFACTDMMVAHTLARHFFWADNILWKGDLRGRNATVSLGGRDLIVDTDAVGKYLSGVDLRSEDSSWKERRWVGVGLETIYFPTCDHAQVFEDPASRRRLGDVLRSYVSTGRGDDDEIPFSDSVS